MAERIARNKTLVMWLAGIATTLVWLAVYLSTVSPTVNFIDSGELITAAYEPGVAHPPGYPLYTLVGFVASRLLWGEVAWRVNVVSAFWGAMAVGAMYFLLVRFADYVKWSPKPKAARAVKRSRGAKGGREQSAPKGAEPRSAPAVPWLHIATGAAGASLLGASATFWSRTAQAKMYSLHYFFVVLLLLLALQYRWAYERGDERAAGRWLVGLAACLGLSFANHLMTVLLPPGVLVLLVWGQDWRERARAILRRWAVVVLLGLAPLLLYLYLPIRAAQEPLMNWGTTNDWSEFWRHVGGWQYRAYLLQDPGGNVGRIIGYFSDQWGPLTFLMLLLAGVSAVLLARARVAVFVATALTAALTLLFAIAYGISEIEPYMVPFYEMMVVWAGMVPVLAPALVRSERPRTAGAGDSTRRQLGWASTVVLGLVAVIAAIVQYPRQDLSDNRLAEQFAMNVFNSLPQNSTLITDYWDFYAPTYYLQDVKGVRPDLAIIDMSLVKYPWYTEQLRKKYPWMIEKSRNILERFSAEQRKWVNGEAYDAQVLNTSYFELLNSFVERSYAERPAYILFPEPTPDNSQVVADYNRVSEGIVSRLWKGDPPAGYAPPEYTYELRGITYDKVPMDDFGLGNSRIYVYAYAGLSQRFQELNQPEKAERMSAKSREVFNALNGR